VSEGRQPCQKTANTTTASTSTATSRSRNWPTRPSRTTRDDQTRRETFALELMEEGRSEEGAAIDLDEEGDHDDPK
jgi:hypothetical protein